MGEETQNKVLQSIANALSMYVYHIDSNGLVNGKMGIMLYLYRYYRHVQEAYYEVFAGELLDGMLKVSRSLPAGFEDGIAGVGWGVDWLMKHGYVEGDPNRVLKPIDDRLLAMTTYSKTSFVVETLNYWAARIWKGIPKESATKLAAGLLLAVTRDLERRGDGMSLYEANIVLHFLWRVKDCLRTEERAKLNQMLGAAISKAFCCSAFNESDVFVFRRLWGKFGSGISFGKEAEAAFHMCASVPRSLGLRIRAAWQEWVYFDEVTCPLPEEAEILHCLDECLQGIRLEDFVLNEGLAGLGLFILNRK